MSSQATSSDICIRNHVGISAHSNTHTHTHTHTMHTHTQLKHKHQVGDFKRNKTHIFVHFQ